MSNPQRDVEAAQAESEDTRDAPLPANARGVRRGHSVVQSVRLPEDAMAAIHEVAERYGVPVGALIRGWILEGLADAQDPGSLRGAIDRLAGDAERLRRIADARNVA